MDGTQIQRCPVVADDGAQCHRPIHVISDPDAHDFVGKSENPVDGGQPWQTWIRQVHAVRALLLTETDDDKGTHTGVPNTKYGEFDDETLPADAQRLADIALAVGLAVHRDKQGYLEFITEAS